MWLGVFIQGRDDGGNCIEVNYTVSGTIVEDCILSTQELEQSGDADVKRITSIGLRGRVSTQKEISMTS